MAQEILYDVLDTLPVLQLQEELWGLIGNVGFVEVVGHFCRLPLFALAQGFCFLFQSLVWFALHSRSVWWSHGCSMPAGRVGLLHLYNVVFCRRLLPSV